MHPKRLFKTAVKSIAVNKSRQALTMLGIVIGGDFDYSYYFSRQGGRESYSWGGAIGIALGVGLSYGASVAINKATALTWVFTFPAKAALIGLGTCTFVGLVFGIYPARQAARKNPVDAMRFE